MGTGGVATFQIVLNGTTETPLACPSSHWEFPLPSGAPITLRNSGDVPLAYIVEPMGYSIGVTFTPGVPTSEKGELVGVLNPGATVALPGPMGQGAVIALLGASRPFSIYDGGFAAQDEWTIAWPMGVSGSEGSSTMYVAEAEWDATCEPVYRP